MIINGATISKPSNNEKMKRYYYRNKKNKKEYYDKNKEQKREYGKKCNRNLCEEAKKRKKNMKETVTGIILQKNRKRKEKRVESVLKSFSPNSFWLWITMEEIKFGHFVLKNTSFLVQKNLLI